MKTRYCSVHFIRAASAYIVRATWHGGDEPVRGTELGHYATADEARAAMRAAYLALKSLLDADTDGNIHVHLDEMPE